MEDKYQGQNVATLSDTFVTFTLLWLDSINTSTHISLYVLCVLAMLYCMLSSIGLALDIRLAMNL